MNSIKFDKKVKIADLAIMRSTPFPAIALNLDKMVKIADLANEVNTIPLQLQINFIELCEDICGL